MLPAATSTTLGGVQPDGVTIANSGGAISVNFGTAANTAAQGNDSRIVGALAATTAAATYAPLASPALTGVPAAPTAAVNTATTQLATTAFVTGQAATVAPAMNGTQAVGVSLTYARQDHVHASDTSRAPLASPSFTGVPAAPTAAPGTSTTQLATTAFAAAAYTLPAANSSTLGGVKPDGTTIANSSGAISVNYGTTGGTAAQGNDTRITLGSIVRDGRRCRPTRKLASPTLTGTPLAPTAAASTNTTQVATTAFVVGQAATVAPVMDGTQTIGVSLTFARQDHVHASDTSRAPLASPTFTGTPAAPTATPGTSTTQVATTAFVGAAAYTLPAATSSTLGGVKPDGQTIVNSAGAVSVAYGTAANTATQGNDSRVTGALSATTAASTYAPLAGPALTGTPTAPTATPGTSTTQLATTAFVGAAAYTLPVATSSILGGVKPDGATIANASGVISVTYGTTANTAAQGNDTRITGALAAATATTTYAPLAALDNTGRNLMHNSMFRVQQRGAGPWTAAGSWTADRHSLQLSTSTASVTIVTLADADRTAIGDEAARYALQCVGSGTAGAGDYIICDQHDIEGVQRISGKTVSVSFWAKATSGTPKVGLSLSQVFGSGGSPSANVTAIGSQSFTLSTAWARYTSTAIAVPTSIGKTFGTTAGTDYTCVQFWQSSGATNNAAAGGIGVQSYTAQLWGEQLEVASVATQLDKPDLAGDLENCQRFFI